MCGKFTQKRAFANLTRLAEAFGVDAPEDTFTPMRLAPVIALDGNGARKSVPMRWGLVPSFARDAADAKPHIHARAETVDVKPTFRDSFEKRRGILLASTFNEGEEVTPSRTQQYVLTPKDGAPVAIAVVWDRWKGEDGVWLLSFAMVTSAANPPISAITDRMPALLEENDWAKWLGEEPATQEELKAMLRPSERELDMRKAEKPKAQKPGPPEQAELF